MTEVLHSPSSSSSPSITTPTRTNPTFLHNDLTVSVEEQNREKRESDRREQLSLLALLVALFRKGFWLNCNTDTSGCGGATTTDVMEIGWPTDVEHVTHVTFDRFDGFLGLPVEFEPEVLRRAPSASTTVFGVSTESMQLSYDNRGNSVPTILLLMQRNLYDRGGLQAEGIFRITAGNSQEEYVREQLNRGNVPDGIDVHCLGGLIKAWFRELPSGVLDPLSPEQVMQCQSEEECVALVRLLPPTEAALLDWAINLMADVVQEEHKNKMNARNIAMVFAPNMTQMADPLTALMYAVQVMNFLKTLIEKTLREREDPVLEPSRAFDTGPSDDSTVHQSSSQLRTENPEKENQQTVVAFHLCDPHSRSASEMNQMDNVPDDDDASYYSTSAEESDASVICGTPQLYRGSSTREAEVTERLQSQRGSDSNWPKCVSDASIISGIPQPCRGPSTKEAEVTKGLQSQRRSSDPNWPKIESGASVICGIPQLYRGSSTGEAEVTKALRSQQRRSSEPNWPKFEWINNGKQDKGSAPKIDSKNKGMSNLPNINSMTERYDAWR